MKQTVRQTPKIFAQKERNRQRLADRYYGKKDILASWEERGMEHVDPGYLRDLSHRIRRHSLDLCYRGMDGFTEST